MIPQKPKIIAGIVKTSRSEVEISFSTAWSVSVTRSTEFFFEPDEDVVGFAEVMRSAALFAIETIKSWISQRLRSAISRIRWVLLFGVYMVIMVDEGVEALVPLAWWGMQLFLPCTCQGPLRRAVPP